MVEQDRLRALMQKQLREDVRHRWPAMESPGVRRRSSARPGRAALHRRRKRGCVSRRPLALLDIRVHGAEAPESDGGSDFFIGSDTAVEGWPLLTRDASRFRTYFPTLQVLAP